MITSRAPTRIGILGGGTDVEPFASKYGGMVLNMAINIRHECRITSELTTIPNTSLTKGIIKFYDATGVDLEESFDGVQSAGLGSSASASVAMIGALNAFLGIKESKYDIAMKAWQAEVNLGWITGKQDQFASAYGGMNFFDIGKLVFHTPIDKEVSESFLPWCLLVYAGNSRHSSDLQKSLRKRMETGSAIESLKKLRSLALEGRYTLESGEFKKLGHLVHLSWGLKKRSNPEVTNPQLDLIYEKARKAGALGGKVMGAGGNGYMFFVVEPSKREEVIKAIGLKEIEFGIDYQGLEVIKR